MKKLIVFIIMILIPALLLAGCGAPANSDARDRLSVVCTIFPQYDWVRQILGEKAEDMDITFLLSNRIDLHNYQASVDDIVKITTCDLFIYVGGASDSWVDGVLVKAVNPDMIVINLLEALGGAAKEEEIIAGMEDDHGDEDDHEDEEGHDDDQGGDHDAGRHNSDEHVWLSLKNAQLFTAVIAKALSSLDAANAQTYHDNSNKYIGQLRALDAEYQAAISAAPVKTLLFGDRFPFRYLLDDYGLSYYAAFSGCSAEAEASFSTIVFLAEKVNELGLKNVMTTESADQSIARTIIANTTAKNQRILVLDAIQSVTVNDVLAGVTYLSLMEGNLNVLKEALQ